VPKRIRTVFALGGTRSRKRPSQAFNLSSSDTDRRSRIRIPKPKRTRRHIVASVLITIEHRVGRCRAEREIQPELGVRFTT
jgi:hypothetical protein